MLDFLRFYWSAKTKYDVHSPFVFTFLTEVLEDDRFFYDFEEMAIFYKKVKSHQTAFYNTLIKEEFGRFLFRVSNFYGFKNGLEIGNNGSCIWLKQAQRTMNMTLVGQDWKKNIEPMAKNTVLSEVRTLTDLSQLALQKTIFDVICIDATALSTIAENDIYLILSCCTPATTVILTGLKPTNRNTLQQLCRIETVTLSLDLYHVALLFFRKEQRQKEAFKLIDHSWKPWSSGFWG
jgi:hypothetical protein